MFKVSVLMNDSMVATLNKVLSQLKEAESKKKVKKMFKKSGDKIKEYFQGQFLKEQFASGLRANGTKSPKTEKAGHNPLLRLIEATQNQM